MAAVATRDSAVLSSRFTGAGRGRLFEPLAEAAYSGGSLERKLLGVWADAAETGSAECLVCGAQTRVTRACDTCGSELS